MIKYGRPNGLGRWVFEPPLGYGLPFDLWHSQFWNNSEIKYFQEKHINAICKYATNNIGYYTQFKNKAFSVFPYISKKDMSIDNFSVETPHPSWKLNSSGSTGEPFLYLTDLFDFSWMAMDFFYLTIIEEYGVSLFNDDKILSFNLNGERIMYNNVLPDIKCAIDIEYNERKAHWISLPILKYADIQELYDIAIKNISDVTCIIAPPSFLIDFLKYCESLKLNIYDIKFVTTSEQVYPEIRKFFNERNIFHRDYYHSPDGGLIFYECAFGKYHFHHTRSYVEFIDINAEKYLCGTTFFNYAMPFIKYINYDSVIGVHENETCQCGRSGLFVDAINGRLCERLIDDRGQNISPMIIYALLSAEISLGKWKIVQSLNNDIILYAENINNTQEAKNKLNRYFRSVEIQHYENCPHITKKTTFIYRENHT